MTGPVQARDLLKGAAERIQAQREAIKGAAQEIAQARMDEAKARPADEPAPE